MHTSKGNKLYGYTLIESLLVLLIFSFFISLPIVVVPRYKERLEVYQFLNQFEKYTLLTQQVAILSDQFTEIGRKAHTKNEIMFGLEYEEELTLLVPPALKVSNFVPIRFTKQSGTVSRLETVRFTWASENQSIYYTFLLGKGHYEKEIK